MSGHSPPRLIRLAELDVPERLALAVPRWMTIAAVGVLCSSVAIIGRALLDGLGIPGAPFALVFPALVPATFFGRWQAGLLAGVLSIIYSWFYSFPPRASFHLVDLSAASTIAVVALGVLLTVALVDLFRRAVRRASAERDRQIADRDLLLAEFDHRMKNNFAIVASILDIQRRRSAGEAADALGAALHRVESIARAHRHLYRGDGQTGMVQIRAYLTDLCAALADVLLLRGGIALTCEADEALVPRDRAVSIGMVANELVTNAAKHAFTGRPGGAILVAFRVSPGGWTLIVSDDGVGMRADAPRPDGNDHGLGSRLIPAFARQAGGTIATESGPHGTIVTLDLPH